MSKISHQDTLLAPIPEYEKEDPIELGCAFLTALALFIGPALWLGYEIISPLF